MRRIELQEAQFTFGSETVALMQSRVHLVCKRRRLNKLNAGNVTQALQSVSGLQSKKNIKPFVIDYDSTNLLLSVVDTGFLIWLDSQTRTDVLDLVGLPKD